jgi:hypothetical protein
MKESATTEPAKAFERLPDIFNGLDASKRLAVAGQLIISSAKNEDAPIQRTGRTVIHDGQ